MEDNAGVKLPPPLLYIVPMLVAIALNHFFPIYEFSPGARWIVGTVLTLVGLCAIGAGVAEFRKFKTSLVPIAPAKAMLEKGVFSKTRNPLYLGLLHIYVGVAFFLSTVWAFIFLPFILLAVTKLVIVKEEAYLERRFGSAYLEYKAHVRRWL